MYVCIRNCFHNNRYFKVGEVAEEYELGETVPHHFEPLNKAVQSAENDKKVALLRKLIKEGGFAPKEADMLLKDAKTIDDQIAVIKKEIAKKVTEAKKPTKEAAKK